MKIHRAWEESLEAHGFAADDAQRRVVDRLSVLQDALQQRAAGGWFRRLLRRRSRRSIRGIYLWGGVGRGKTFLMDLFFDSLAVEDKRRIHFHRIMQEVHQRLANLTDIEDPLDQVAADMAAQFSVLCFDEFYVSDIGDAMILGRLLDGLFCRGVTLVTTSNSPPDDLYRDGLQRQRFLPAIEALKKYTDVLQLDGATDYRLRLLQKAGTWLSPPDDKSRQRLARLFADSASSNIDERHSLDINARPVAVERSAKGIAWFDFDALCGGPRSQSDYIEIARWFPSVIVSAVPRMDASQDDRMRRFIALVDEFYDRRVKLIVSAECAPEQLYTGSRLAFEFERTLSRLIEMQSTDYLALPHLA